MYLQKKKKNATHLGGSDISGTESDPISKTIHFLYQTNMAIRECWQCKYLRFVEKKYWYIILTSLILLVQYFVLSENGESILWTF